MKNLFKFLSKLTALFLVFMAALNFTDCFCMGYISPNPRTASKERPITPTYPNSLILRSSRSTPIPPPPREDDSCSPSDRSHGTVRATPTPPLPRTYDTCSSSDESCDVVRFTPTPPPPREDDSCDPSGCFQPIRYELKKSQSRDLQNKTLLCEIENESFENIRSNHYSFLKKHHHEYFKKIKQIAVANGVSLGLMFLIIYNPYDLDELLEDIESGNCSIQEFLTILENYQKTMNNIINEANNLLMRLKEGLPVDAISSVDEKAILEGYIKEIIAKVFFNFQTTLPELKRD